MKIARIILLVLNVLAPLFLACDKEPTETKEIIVTGEVTDITANSAKISAYVYPSSYLEDMTYGILLSTEGSPSKDNGQVHVSSKLEANNMFTVIVTGLTSNTTYYYKSFVQIEGVSHFGSVKSFTTLDIAVDLGLSVKWAPFNIGASKPEELGDFFAWGETSPKDIYSWETYKWCNGSEVALTKYNSELSFGSVDNRTMLSLSDDAARANWGGKWRMPTRDEYQELEEECTWTWTVQGGMKGYLVTSKINGNSIFLPAGGAYSNSINNSAGIQGYYWSSSLDTSSDSLPIIANNCCFYDSYLSGNSILGRFAGASVRAVYGDPIQVSQVCLDLSQLTISLGNITCLYSTVLPENAANKAIIWSSDDPSVVSVDSNGYVTANQVGSAVISVTSEDGGKTAHCSVTVTQVAKPTAVDLGLSVKWASCNVGASFPEENGYYYAWGEIIPKTSYSWKNYKWCNGTGDDLTRYNNNPSNGDIDNRSRLLLSDDAARMFCGDKWRTPTKQEFDELVSNCTVTWTTQGRSGGYLLTSKINGNTIFLPAAGYAGESYYKIGSSGIYWSSSLCTTPISAWHLRFDHEKSSFQVADYHGVQRCLGGLIRPVYGEEEMLPVSGINLDKAELSLGVGGGAVLFAKVFPESASNPTIKWSSSSSSVASVDAAGFVTAKQAGKAVITVTTDDGGKSAQCVVTVTQPDGPEAIDLGLSVQWASYNVGATKPEEYGDYFAWGETSQKNDYSWDYYKWCDGKEHLTKYNNSSLYGIIDNKNQLDLSDDAARVNWGGEWRLPTNAEFEELLKYCVWTWTTQGGISGFRVTSRINGYCIFLPAAGSFHLGVHYNRAGSICCYWSSSLYENDPRYAFSLDQSSIIRNSRCSGSTIRPVMEK